MSVKNIINKCRKIDFDKAPHFDILCTPWSDEYKPKSFGQALICDGIGLVFRLTSYEENPIALYSAYGDPVHLDSCLEFFCALDNQSSYYLNFEANANGAFVCAKRPGRQDKTPIDKLIDISKIKVEAIKEKKCWFVEFTVPFSVIDKFYRPLSFDIGYRFKGNMYKCGDNTPIPHWLSLFPIDTPEPDFHRPEFFGEFEIGDYIN